MHLNSDQNLPFRVSQEKVAPVPYRFKWNLQETKSHPADVTVWMQTWNHKARTLGLALEGRRRILRRRAHARTNRSAICVGFHDFSTHVWVPSSANKSELAVNARGWWRELKQRLFKTKTDFIWTSGTHASSQGFEGSGESDCRRNSKVGQRKSNQNVNSPATTIAQSCWLHSRFITVYQQRGYF